VSAPDRDDFVDDPSLGWVMPTGETVRKADAAMARLAKQLCPFCGLSLDEDGRCDREGCQ
jgi:hypothetical protein